MTKPSEERGLATSQLPLAGAILCCTSIAPEQRAQIAAMGAHMGAAIKLDLTSDVTHLIVGSTDSAKYRYVAKSRDDVKVLSPSWIDALREVWMAGEDNMGLQALEHEHRMPTLFGLKICLTGFDNPEQRRSIQDAVDRNGAEYHGDLTKSVTHLIAATPAGKKYEHALNWSVKIVALEWLEQSLERGMALDETLFHPTLPVEVRGKGAWDRTASTSTAGKRAREPESQALHPFRRKLRRSASTRLGGQSEALWAGITAAGSERQQDDGEDWTEHNIAQQNLSTAHTPAFLAGGASTPEEPDSGPTSAGPNMPSTNSLSKRHSHQGIFEGRIVCPYGFDNEKTEILRQHLTSHGGQIISIGDLSNIPSDQVKHGFLVLPHDADVDLTPIPDRAGSLLSVVSNWWVERCLHGKRLVDPAEDVLSRPFGKLSVCNFSGLTVNSTGFVGIELLHVTKIVALMGATYDEHLSANTSVLVCNSTGTNPQKLKFAAEKRIPAVTSAWLSDCIRNSRLLSFDEYRISTLVALQPRMAKSTTHAPAAVALSDGNANIRLGKTQPAKVQSKPQALRRPRTLELAPSAKATPVCANDTDASTLRHHESSLSNLDGHASLQQEIGANSLARPSAPSGPLDSHSRQRSSSAESLISRKPRPFNQQQQPTDDPVMPTESTDKNESLALPPDAPKELAAADKDYSEILAQLRASRKTAPTPTDQPDGSRRRRRQLGRATSTRSDHSAASSGNTCHNMEAENDGDEEDSVLVEENQPSQRLGWDEPGAAKAREVMIKRLGGTIKDRSVPVEGIGVVMDEAGDGLGRSIRKRRG